MHFLARLKLLGAVYVIVMLSDVTWTEEPTRPAQRRAAGRRNRGRGGPRDDYTGDSANVSRLLDSLLRGYDKRLRPNYSGKPVEVGITVFISSVSHISEVNMDFTVDFYFRQHWHDPRLNFSQSARGQTRSLQLKLENLKSAWMHRWSTFFANAKLASFHLATTRNAFLRISPSGWITQSLRLTVTAMCPMDLTYFPMDSQICPLEIESYAYSVKHIIYKWKDGPMKSVGMDPTVQLPQFTVKGYRAKNKLESLSTGNYSRLACEFYFVRSLGYYIIHIYVPSCLIVVLSWISFWLHRDASPARVALGITTVLTMTTVLSSANAALPKISYLKSIDIFLVTCFVMVFASLLEFACVSFLGRKKSSSTATPAATAVTVSAAAAAERAAAARRQAAVKRLEADRAARSRWRSARDIDDCLAAVPLRETSSWRGGGAGVDWQPRHHGSLGNNATVTFNGTATDPMPSEIRLRSQTTQTVPVGAAWHRFPLPVGHTVPVGPCDVRTPLSCMPLAAASNCPAHCDKLHNQNCSSSTADGRPPAARPDALQPSKQQLQPNTDKPKPNRCVAMACAIDKYSRVVFPAIFLVFNVVYWVIYLNISSRPREADFVFFDD